MTAEGRRRPPATGEPGPTAREFFSLQESVRDLVSRVRAVERVMYVMTGVGTATGATAIYNLVENLSR